MKFLLTLQVGICSHLIHSCLSVLTYRREEKKTAATSAEQQPGGLACFVPLSIRFVIVPQGDIFHH